MYQDKNKGKKGINIDINPEMNSIEIGGQAIINHSLKNSVDYDAIILLL